MVTFVLGLCLAGALGSVYVLSRAEHRGAPRAKRTLQLAKPASPAPVAEVATREHATPDAVKKPAQTKTPVAP